MNMILEPEIRLLGLVYRLIETPSDRIDETISECCMNKGCDGDNCECEKCECDEKNEIVRRDLSCRYRKSVFNYVLKNKRGAIIYNTFYNSMFRMSKNEFSMYSEDSPDEAFLDELVENGFYVDFRIDEMADFMKMADVFKNSDVRNPAFVITPTTRCNARCPYCFEVGAAHENMDRETALKTAEWIAALPFDYKNVHITWFGGEPLLKPQIIKILTSRLTELNVPFVSGIITNGSLLGCVDFDSLIKEYHISNMQITLDGFPEKYAEKKKYIRRNGVEVYSEILDNIEKYTRKYPDFTVQIRLNIDFSNRDEMAELTLWLKERFSDLQNVSVYPAFVCGTGRSLSENEKEETVLAIYKAMKDISHTSAAEAFTRPPRFIPCHICNPDAFTIDAKGRIYTCEHDVGKISRAIGSVFEDYSSLSNERIRAPEFRQCHSCVFLPKCGGGCHGNFEAGDEPCFEIKYTMQAYMQMMG